MIRSLTAVGFAFALAGAAQAAPTPSMVVQTAGLSAPAARAELYKAAKAVCSTNGAWDAVCVDETYGAALSQLRPAPRTQPIAFRQAVLAGR